MDSTLKNIKYVFAGIVILLVGITFGVFLARLPKKETARDKFINPTVSAHTGKHFIINFQPVKDKLMSVKTKYSETSYIYFSYLNNAAWVGLGEKEKFIAASTIKVPLAMSIYKAVEEGKLSLSDEYTLQESDLDDRFGELYKDEVDKTFTIQELLRIMLEQSDNTATRALINVMKERRITDLFSEVYDFMGWEYDKSAGPGLDYLNINLKTLSNMFLALYNATYVNIEHSEQILEHLDNSPFDNQITAGVPKQVPVAHKIGVNAPNNSYSDCGIVYAPNRHYILCLAFLGTEDRANNFMSEVSKEIYQYVISN
jgi:beta-lactamase class A